MPYTDTERMDFIERTKPIVSHNGSDWKPPWWVVADERTYFAHSLREALDQAMDAERKLTND